MEVETVQAFGALFQIPHYYWKFLYCKTKILCTYTDLFYIFTCKDKLRLAARAGSKFSRAGSACPGVPLTAALSYVFTYYVKKW
jgi:hypothetical protein